MSGDQCGGAPCAASASEAAQSRVRAIFVVMFRTEIVITQAARQFSRSAHVLTMGSCFADSIGSRLKTNKVATLVNPFGTVFQPLAAGRLLRAALGEEVDWQQHLVEARGRWQSYDLHGSIGAASPVDLLLDIQELARRTGEFLRNADVVVLTLGTAWAYRLRETGELVNNCHKMPAELFDKELLTPDEIINALAETHAFLKRINSKLRIVLTVSPVRHIKDTLPLNAVSKSVLRVACHYLSDLLKDVDYFPAFELMTDDLRDYRFYAADMLHPSEVAEDFIWDKFARAYFDADFGRFRKEWASVRQALHHRPLYAEAPEHRSFLEATLQRLERLHGQQVDVAAELEDVRERIAALPVPPQPAPEIVPDDDEERIDVGLPAVEAVRPTAEAAAVQASAQPERSNTRLSPEEFRAQRAARGGRNQRGSQRNTPASSPIETETEPLLAAVEAVMEAPTVEVEEVAAVADTAIDLSVTASDEEPKKKKRRSRGGAKRTARKNAARLAAELAALGLQAEIPTEETGVVTTAAEEPITSAVAIPAQSVAAPTSRHGRQQGKKSSVITKSVPVKRGRQLYAQAPPVVAPVEVTPVILAIDVTTVDAAPAVMLPSEPIQAVVPELLVEPIAEPAFIPEAPISEPALQLEASVEAEPEAAVTTPEAAPVAKARKPSRARGRAIIGGRTEKPAVDTPIIPVEVDALPRTSLAAGRLTGSSASLVKAAETALSTVTKALPIEEVAEASPAPAAPKKPRASKATKKAVVKPAATTAEAPAPLEPDLEVIQPVITEPVAAEPAKPKRTTTKKKSPTPALVEQPATKPKAAKASKPKATSESPAAPPKKPKTPHKPAKSA